MSPDGRYTAVLDRFEEGVDTRYAVLILEGDEEGPLEFVVNASGLPSEATHQDAILDVFVDEGDLVEATYDAERTEQRRETAQDRFDRLARRPGDRQASASDAERDEE